MAGDDIVAEARRWIGTPYVHQASCRGAGTDCLGLVLGLWRYRFGRLPGPVPPYTADWAEPGRREELLHAARHYLLPVGHRAVRPGDVILFRMRSGQVAKHLGVLSVADSAGARFIHAYSGHGVVESALTDPWRRRIAARFSFPEGAC